MLTLSFVVDSEINFWFNVFNFLSHCELSVSEKIRPGSGVCWMLGSSLISSDALVTRFCHGARGGSKGSKVRYMVNMRLRRGDVRIVPHTPIER